VADTSESAADRAALAQAAAVWGLPLVMMGRYLEAAESGGVPFNQFFMNTEVATPQSRAVGPNIDTLNGRAWLDLTAGPQVIVTPDTDDRYYSVQLQDLYMNSFAYIGRRTTGTRAGAFAVTPPGFEGLLPEGVTEIRATTSKVMAFVRTLVRGPKDLPAAQAINTRFTLGPLSAWPEGRREAVVAPGAIDAFQPASRRARNTLPHDDIAQAGAGYFDELDRLLRAFPPLPDDAAQLAHFAALGLGTPQPASRDAGLEADLAAAVPAGVAAALRGLTAWSDNGWSRRPNVEAFIDDPLQRAANNIFGPNTQIAAESVFFNKRQGEDGKPLSGANRYRLRFAPGQTPPVDAFWSLTLYDKSYVLFDNPIDRYGVTDRTEGLRYGADGSLEIRIQADEPAEGPSNWLPSPQDAFQLVLRTYQPRQPLLDRSYKPPPLEVVAGE
jgi:hypothetical protein